MTDEELDPRARAGETKRRRTRDKLIHAADVVLRDEGFGATVEDIAEEAGVSTATFYTFYTSRNLLAVDAFKELVIEQLRRLDTMHRPLKEAMQMVWDQCSERNNLVRAALVGRMEQGSQEGDGFRAELLEVPGYGYFVLGLEAIAPYDFVDYLAEVIWKSPQIDSARAEDVKALIALKRLPTMAALQAATLKLLDDIAMNRRMLVHELAALVEGSIAACLAGAL